MGDGALGHTGDGPTVMQTGFAMLEVRSLVFEGITWFQCCPLFLFLLLLHYLFAFSEYILYMDRVATTVVFLSFSEWVFYFVTTGWILEIGLCEN